MRNINWKHILAIFLFAKLLLHFYVNTLWSFHRDEFLYLALGRHLDWGFASVPPAIGFWGWLTGEVLGGSVAVVRMVPLLFGVGTLWLTGLIAREMLPSENSGRFSMVVIGLTGLLGGAFLRPSMMFMPVICDIFYWTLVCWLFLKYIKTGDQKWLLWTGLATGLAFLNKYAILILLFAFLPGVLFTKQRKIFQQRGLYLAILIALILASPNILWQAQNGFPVFRHIGELATTQFVNVSKSAIIFDQLMFFIPALPVWLAGLYFLLFRNEAQQWRMFGWMYLMVMAVLLFFSAKSYYSLGAYPVLIAAGAAFIETKSTKKQWIRFVLIVFMLAFGLLTMPAALPLFKPEKEAELTHKLVDLTGMEGILRWEDGELHPLPQDFADMIGWEELAKAVGQTVESIPDKSGVAIYAENYGQAGSIEHLGGLKGEVPVFSFSDAYSYWLPDSLPEGFKTLIYVNDELGDDMPGFFEKIEKVWELDMPLSRQHGNQIYKCENPTPAFFERINGAINAAKNHETVR